MMEQTEAENIASGVNAAKIACEIAFRAVGMFAHIEKDKTSFTIYAPSPNENPGGIKFTATVVPWKAKP